MKRTPALGSNPLPSAQQLAFQSALALVSSLSPRRDPGGSSGLPYFAQGENPMSGHWQLS